MKNLNELYNTKYNVKVKDIKTNSKDIKRGDLFVCIKGVNEDRHNFIDDAINNGAVAIITEKDIDYSIPYIKVYNANKELEKISKIFYNNPLKSIFLIGITGTDGKTSTASIIRNLLGNDICGYIGTLGFMYRNKTINTNNTTPDINVLYKYFDILKKNKNKYATMEVSSEGLLRDRVNNIKFDIAILTNITGDHLNIHKTMNNYINAKLKLFNKLNKNGVAILNRDDKYFEYFNENIKRKIITYGKNKKSDLVIKKIKEGKKYTSFKVNYKNKTYKILSPLLGEFNVYNLCSGIITLDYLGYNMKDIISRINSINIPNGRCEFINFKGNYDIVLDYAHTPNGLKNILLYLNKIKKGRIITITGSAGGREKEKRSEMGKVVLELSDLVIFTMDDPRYEKVEDIINDMIGNSKKTNYTIIIDREKAIKYAIDSALKNDIILVVGKGRDNYMAIEDKYVKYNDYDVIKKYVK